jgi:predicted XRE-type DNA-binding protein
MGRRCRPDQAADLRARAELVRKIAGLVQESKWTQSEAAGHCGIPEPRINDLLRGRVSQFSLGALANIAAAICDSTVWPDSASGATEIATEAEFFQRGKYIPRQLDAGPSMRYDNPCEPVGQDDWKAGEKMSGTTKKSILTGRVNECDPSLPRSAEEQAWLNMPPVGQEFGSNDYQERLIPRS